MEQRRTWSMVMGTKTNKVYGDGNNDERGDVGRTTTNKVYVMGTTTNKVYVMGTTTNKVCVMGTTTNKVMWGEQDL